MTGRSTPMVGRATLAVALFVGFYLLALGIAFALVYVPYHQFMYGGGVRVYSAALMILTGLIILVSVFPRRDRFAPPGPRLQADDHPALFDELQQVAQAMGQPMPDEVYLLADANAWVSQRGGLMGFGGRRVLGIGLPLLQLLTAPQLRAVIAHELGHFHHGDTALGPWLYRTRGAIARTVESTHGALLQAPFRWYGALFLAVTGATSRRQEHAADALAAELEGGDHLASALRTIGLGAPLFDQYWRNDYLPALAAGFEPPLLDGFARACSARGLRDRIERGELAELPAHPYDTHPPLADRLRALSGRTVRARAGDARPGLALLSDRAELEARLVQSLAGDIERVEIPWEEVGDRVYADSFLRDAEQLAPMLSELTCATIPYEYEDLAELGREILGDDATYKTADDLKEYALEDLELGIFGALLRRRWQLRALPGEPLTLIHADHSLAPRTILLQLYAGDLAIEAWRKDCRAMGIADIHLGASA